MFAGEQGGGTGGLWGNCWPCSGGYPKYWQIPPPIGNDHDGITGQNYWNGHR